MIEVAIMIEGQNGLNWDNWRRIATAVEALGFVGLYRSDHYTNAGPPDVDSLELWVSLTWLAGHTQHLEFGPMVSPVSFRQPTMTARMAAAVDDLSNGRLTLGLGAGWQEREHQNYGWELLPLEARFQRYEEGVQIIKHLLQADTPLDFEGTFYQLHDAVVLPRPQRQAGPPILLGGNGPKRTLPMVANYATEWNGVYLPPETFAERNRQLDELLRQHGREPASVRRSLMTGCWFSEDEKVLTARAAQSNLSLEEARARGIVMGGGNQMVEQLGALAEAGAQRVMLQWLDLDDMDGLAALAESVLPQVQ